MKNIAFLYSGKPYELESLEEDCNAVAEVLTRYKEWEVLANRPLESEKKLRKDFKHHEREKVENLFIFYTGHAKAYSEDGKTKNKLKLCLINDDYDVQIILNSILDTFIRLPKRTVIVLDACYSGTFIYDATRFSNTIEIISSSLPRLKSSSISPSKLSLFTHYFCESVTQLSIKNEDVNFQNICKYINDNNEQKCSYLPPIFTTNRAMIVTKNRMLYKLISKIKIHYQNKMADEERQIATFRYDILRYYPRVKEKIYNTIRESTTMDELFMALLKDEKGGYLYCILKFLKIEDDYLINFKGAKKCNEITSKIESIIVVVEGSTNNSNRYTADIYCGLDNDKVEHYEYIEECVWNELYQIEIKRVLEEILALNCIAKMELQMVLPIKLMSSEFKNEKVHVGTVEGIPLDEAWGREFNIITKFHSRLKGYVSESDKYFEAWEVNLKRYLNALEDTIGSKSYPLPSIDKISNFCDNDALFLLSEKSLIDDNPLVQLYVLGVPFMITTQNDECNFTTDEKYREWKESKVKEIKPSSYRFINEIAQELHFLCDDGYSDSFLKAFQNKGEKKEKTFLGDEYE